MWIKDKASRLALGAGVAAAGALALAGPAAAASGSLPQDGQPVSLNPADSRPASPIRSSRSSRAPGWFTASRTPRVTFRRG
jgi:hypothetical protein